VSAEIFRGGATSTFCLSFPGFWRYNANGCSHDALLFYTTKKMPHERKCSIRIYFEIFFKCNCIRICHSCDRKSRVASFRISSHFALWEAVFRRKYCCSPNIKYFGLPIFLAHHKFLRCLRHCVTVSLHHLSKMSEVNSYMRKNALTIVPWSEPLKIRCHVIVTQHRATVEQCARKFRNVWVCRRLSGPEWTASSSLHHTRTVNLALVQCEFHTSK